LHASPASNHAPNTATKKKITLRAVNKAPRTGIWKFFLDATLSKTVEAHQIQVLRWRADQQEEEHFLQQHRKMLSTIQVENRQEID
jgi:hypothetical protein